MATSDFRSFLPNGQHPRLGTSYGNHDIYSWTQHGLEKPMIQDLWSGWQQLSQDPFKGIITDGRPPPSSLFTLRSENAPIAAMTSAANQLLSQTSQHPSLTEKLRYPLDAPEWRGWSNPEFYFVQKGLRLEECPSSVISAVLELVKASLSPRGYQDTLDAMRTNGFLGDLVGAPALLNERSYNVILFGEPDLHKPWGWSLWGHHLTLCVFVLGEQMVVSPVFRGCEPNRIDSGIHAKSGVEMFKEEMRLATNMMQTLTDEERRSVIVYKNLDDPLMPPGFPHPADGRNLAGAFQDNAVIPYSGGLVTDLSSQAQDAVLALITRFLDFLPDGPLQAKMEDIKRHWKETWLMWMGGYGEEDVFHFRIQSLVVLCEFDHECGMWLKNDEPGRFHVHTVVRTPNGNDYGKELLRLWREKGQGSTNGV